MSFAWGLLIGLIAGVSLCYLWFMVGDGSDFS